MKTFLLRCDEDITFRVDAGAEQVSVSRNAFVLACIRAALGGTFLLDELPISQMSRDQLLSTTEWASGHPQAD